MKKVLVTGASGFIGRHTLKYLLPEFDEVHGVYARKPLEEFKDVKWHRVDLLDSDYRDKLINTVRPTHLLHFAWYAEPGKYAHSLMNIKWLQSSLDLIQRFTEHGGERTVCAGTCFEYDFNYGLCSEYKTPKNPETIYGVCKNSLQNIIHHFSKKSELSSAWGRIFYLYGPYEYPSRLVSSVILSLLKNENARCSEGTQFKDFLHVDDVARAFVSLLKSRVEGAVNIGSGYPVRVKDVVIKIGELLNKRNMIDLGARPTPASEPPLIVADTKRLFEEVYWEPVFDLTAGLEDTIHWWKKSIG